MLEHSTQHDRQARIKTSLGEDMVLLERFDAEERLSDPFEFTAEIRSERGEIDFLPELGGPVAVSIHDGDEIVRWFHGILFEAELLGYDKRAVRYKLTINPWLSLLEENTDCRIYQDKTVVEIIQDVFDRAGFSDYDFGKLPGGYAQREYCVQFRESDFDFVSRLMEDEGIYYYFKHEADKHTLILCAGRAAHSPAKGWDEVIYDPGGNEEGGRFGHMWEWTQEVSRAAAKVSLRDYNFKKPQVSVAGEAKAKGDHPHDSAEIYDYPAEAMEKGEADSYAEQWLQQERAERRKYWGEGDTVALACGGLVKLKEHPDPAFDQEYLIVEAEHRFLSEAYMSMEDLPDDVSEDEDPSPYMVSIGCTPAAVPWQCQTETDWPVPAGPQTAVVTGPAGEVIYVDEFARVKVQFPWDRQGKNDDKTSCWMRVSQGWAGEQHGQMFIPRIGDEVLVDFLDGDIDRPLIIGRLFNGANTVPYLKPDKGNSGGKKPPDQKTVSFITTRTVGSPGDYDEAEEPPPSDKNVGHNTFTFEDLGGSEEINVHAQRLMKTWVRLDDDHKVGRDQTERVGRSRTVNIKKDLITTVETGDETRKVAQGGRATTIQKDDATTIDRGNHTLKISAGDQKINVDAGNQNTKVAQKISIDAGVEITLTVGSNSIKIDNTGVTIKGLMVKAEADTQMTIKGAMTDVKGDAMTTVKGGIVMIN